MTPFPQLSIEQVEGVLIDPPEHFHPGSGPVQSVLQPVSGTALLRSSQTSFPTTIPSWQIGEQIVGFEESPPTQFQPGAVPKQSDVHFSSLIRLPSSQISGEMTFPSPQVGLQTDVEVPVEEQVHPDSGPEQSYLHLILSSV